MEHHLLHDLRHTTRLITSNCSNAVFNAVKKITKDTLLDDKKMDFWNSINNEIKKHNGENFNPETKNVSASQANGTMIRGRHDYPFKTKKNNIFYLDCLCPLYRSQYVGYTDNIPLSQVVSGLLTGDLSDCELLNKEYNKYCYHKLSKTLNWFNSDLNNSIKNIEKDENYCFLFKELKEDIGELNYCLQYMIKRTKKEDNYLKDFPDVFDFIQHVSELNRKSDINLSDLKILSKNIEITSKKLSFKKNTLNLYDYSTFKNFDFNKNKKLKIKLF